MEILNTGLYNFQGDVVSVKVLGHNLTTDKIGLYTMDIPVHEPLSGFPTDFLLGRGKNQNQIFDTTGELCSITLSEANIPTYEGSLTVSDNSLMEINKTVIKGYRNALDAMLLCESFYDSATGDKIRVLGVGGNVKLASGMLRNKDWKYFFELDNKLIKAYTGSETANIFLGAYNRTSLCSALEVKQISNTDVTKVLKYSAIFCSGEGLSEANESNTVATNIKFCSDFRTYNQTMEEGFAADNVDLKTSTTIARFNVDFIMSNATGASPSDFGTAGQIAAVINTATGAVKVQETNGADTWTDITGTFVDGALIFGTKVGTTTVAATTNGYTYVAIKTGALAGGTAVATTVTNQTTYTLGTTYTLPIYKFSFADGKFNVVEDLTDL